MAAGGSKRVILFALGANSGIAVAKFVAATVTGSSAMLAEAIHSVADSANQLLLLLGAYRSERPPDRQHPLGYGREAYFWALIVAVMLFSVGGLFSVYEGIHKLQHPEPLTSPWWAVGVLVFGVLLEGASFLAAWRQCSLQRGETGLLAWSRSTGDVNLLVVVFEDLAALLGLVFALVAVLLAMVTGNPLFDALGTCLIGVLLLAVAVFVAAQVRRLIVGFAAGPSIYADMEAVWDRQGFDVLDLAAVWCGPQRLLVVSKVRPRDAGADSVQLVHRLDEAERAICDRYPEIAFHFVEPQFDDEGEEQMRAP